MTAFVLDASVVLKWFLPEAGTETAIRFRGLDMACEAPDLLLLEVANALWKHVQRGSLDAATAGLAVSALDAPASAATIPAGGTQPDHVAAPPCAGL